MEKTSAPSAADARPNSDAVPAGYAIDTKFERIVVLRFKYDTDLLAGLESMVRQEKIRQAVILAGIGSVRSYHFHAVSNREFPSKDIFVTNPTGSADLVTMNGYVIRPRPRPRDVRGRGQGLRRPPRTGHQGVHLCDRDPRRGG